MANNLSATPVSNPPAKYGIDSCLVTNRNTNSDNWIGQDITDILNRNGQGYYDISAWLRSVTSGDKAFSITVTLYASGSGHEFSIHCTANDTDWGLVAGVMNLTWSGNLDAAYMLIRQDTNSDDYLVSNGVLAKVDQNTYPNLLPNPGFENGGTDGWMSNNMILDPVINPPAKEGSYSCLVSDLTPDNDHWVGQDVTDILNQNGPGNYDVSAWLKSATSGSKAFSMTVTLYDENGGREISIHGTADDTVWCLLAGTLNLTWSGSHLDAAYILIRQDTNADNYYLDDCLLAKR